MEDDGSKTTIELTASAGPSAADDQYAISEDDLDSVTGSHVLCAQVEPIDARARSDS